MDRAARMTRARRLVIDMDRVLAADTGLAESDAMWVGKGYVRSSARLWQCRDGSYTARLVWRKRADILSTITFTVRGLVLA
jgi:hypothetical protein